MIRKTPEEEEVIFNNIDKVSDNLTIQIKDLQKFINDLRVPTKTNLPRKHSNGTGGDNHG